MYSAYDRGILIEGHISTFDDDRTPEEAAARLKGTSESRRFIWRKFWSMWDGIDECEEIRITEAIEEPEYPQLQVMYFKDTKRVEGTLNGKKVIIDWPTYPEGQPRIATMRGLLPIDQLQDGEVFLQMPEYPINPDVPPPVAKPAAPSHLLRKVALCIGWGIMVVALVCMWAGWPA